ncbi:MAG: DUF11 domain-containing protein [Methanobacterium sp.]|nr:DUF11 domain-containing protein [Methanobacterium sp.]
MIFFVLAFAIILAICGTSSAATVQNNTTISHTDSSAAHILLKTNAKKTGSTGDPIITGTVTINRYGTGTYYALKGATITVNSTSGRVLGTTTTDQNGNYYINFYSTDTRFLVTSSFLGCNSTTNTVNVNLNSTDGIYYGTSNFKLTPNTANLTSTGTGTNIKTGTSSGSDFAGVINVKINGVSYQAYCIDLYTNIAVGNSLFVNGPLPGTIGDLNSQIDWGKVNYIIKNYSPTTDTEAAAMQCAIWYFTSVQYGAYPGNDTSHPGRYQFMTYSGDGLLTGGGTAVRTRALQMISAATSVQYPTNINLQPGNVRVPNGGSTTLTATVTDSNGNPMSGITVNFYTNKGTLSSASGTTNALGQISTILSGLSSSSATVYAMVNGTYGTLLYDNPANPLQNLVAVNAIPYTFSDSSTVNFDVTSNVQLSQTSTTPVNVGDTYQYVIKAHNYGPNAATGILISDVIPPGLTNYTVTPSVGTFINGVWTIPTLANGAEATLTITGTALSSMAGTTNTNTATITGQDQYNSNLNTPSLSDVYTKKSVLSITNSATNSNVNVGDTGKFTITIYNSGPDAASNIQLSDILPAGYSASWTAGNYANNIWTINSLASGGTATLTFTGAITPSMAGKTTTNHATVTWAEYPKTVTISDSTIYVKDAEVALSQTTSGTNVNVGDTVTYTVTAKNNGPDTATNILISDNIPSGLTNVIITPSIGTYSNGVWTIPTLTSSQTATLTITGTVGPTMAGKNTTNTATRTSQTEYNSQATTTTSSPIYTKKADVKLSQTSTSPINVGDVVKYIVTAFNSGPDTASNVNIKDLLPSQLIGVIATPSVGTFSNGIWTIPTLANGQTATLTITGTASSSMAGTTTTNTATRTSQTEFDSQPTTTTANVYTKIVNLNISNSANNGKLNVGDTGQFTITIKNNGPDDATNINIKDLLPAGFTATATDGIYDGTTWIINNLASENSATLTFTGIITPSMAGKTITNHATATWTEFPNTLPISDATIYVKDAEVELSQTVNSPVNVGDVVKFVVKATNKGPDDATNIIITDLVPTSLKNVIVTPSIGTFSNGVWTIPTLANGQTATLIIRGIATKSMCGINTTNTATRTSQTEYNSQNNVSKISVYTKIDPVDIEVLQMPWYYNADTQDYQYLYECHNTPVFTTLAINQGPDDATNLVIQYTIGSGLKYEGCSLTAGTVTQNGNTLTWTIDYIPNGGYAIMKVFTTITETGTQTPNLTNTATLQSVDQEEIDTTNDQSTCKLTVPTSADIQVTQDNPVINNGQVSITVHVTNNGPDTATGVLVNSILSGLSFKSASMNIGSYNSNTGIWNIGNLLNGQSGTLNLVFTATNSAIKSTFYSDRNDAVEFDWNATNDAQTKIVNSGYKPSADIDVIQIPWYYNADTQDYQYLYECHNTPVFTTLAINQGPDDATNLVIQYTIGSGLKYEGCSLTAGTVTQNGNTLTWTIDYIPNGGYAIMKVFTTITETGTQTPNLTNTATLQSVDQEEIDTTNDQSTCKLTVPTSADIQVTQNYNKYLEGDDIYADIYITVTNNGPDTATGVVVNDKLPAGLTFVASDLDNYDPTTGNWNIGNLNSGETQTIKITVIITQDSTNTAYTDRSDSIEFDWNATNDGQTLSILDTPPVS